MRPAGILLACIVGLILAWQWDASIYSVDGGAASTPTPVVTVLSTVTVTATATAAPDSVPGSRQASDVSPVHGFTLMICAAAVTLACVTLAKVTRRAA